MAKVIVGITGNEKEMPAMSGIKYVAVAQDLSEGVKQAGGLPIVIPIGKPELAKDYVDMVDKLILSGGQHVDPRFYGQEKEIDSDDYSLARDQFELALIKEALRSITDMTRREKAIFAPLIAMTLILGIYPSLVTDIIGPSVGALVTDYQAAQPADGLALNEGTTE